MLLHILARAGWKILSIVLLSKITLTHDFQLLVAGDWAKNNGSFVEERSNRINSSYKFFIRFLQQNTLIIS